ncbi:recombination regulator RecX [Robbsia andropogonis]|uniref:recombination regulator RecX n=2 Tax=Robbsia andropogonis TaxID=28092 RepID=UPI0004B82D3D
MRSGFSRGRRTASTTTSGGSEPSGMSAGEPLSGNVPDGFSASDFDAAADPCKSKRPLRSLRGRALEYLSRREHSRIELTRKLAPFAAEMQGDNEDDPLPVLLDALEREGWLSDSRFTESVVHRKAARFGTSRIVGELKQHAIAPDQLANVRDALRETEPARARAVWQRKFGTLPDSPQARAKQARFLAARGFSMDVIRCLLNADEDDLLE